MSRAFSYVILCIVCLGLTISISADVPVGSASCVPVGSLSAGDLAFKAGERLDYVIHYKWGAINSDVSKAYVQLDSVMYEGKPAFHCRVFGRTAKFYDVFFKVREDFQSWFTMDGIVPLRFTRDTREGGYTARNTYKYVWDDGDRHIAADLYSSKRGERSESLPLTECTYDLPSLFYMARNMDFSKVEPNVKYPMTFAIDDDIYNVYFIWLGREVKQVRGLGKVNTIKFAAKLIEGEVFGSDSDMCVWISDDENRIPVFFEAPIKVGLVNGRLSSWENLKHPFSSRVGK